MRAPMAKIVCTHVSAGVISSRENAPVNSSSMAGEKQKNKKEKKIFF